MKKLLSVAFLLVILILFKDINAQNFWLKMTNPSVGTIASVFIDTSGYVFLGSNGGEIRGSSDKGNTWTKLNNGLHGTNLMRAIVADNKGNIFAGGTGGVWISTDHGGSWSNVSQGITDQYIYSLIYTQEIDTTKLSDTTFFIDTLNVLYAGTYSKGIFRSTDQGKSWTFLPGFSDVTSHVNDLKVNPVNGNIFAGTYYEGVFRSTNKGQTWAKINNGISNLYVEELTIDSLGNVFAGTHGGVYRSQDNGNNWTKVGLDSIIVLSLANYKGSILAGTDRKGVYLSTDEGAIWKNTGIPNDLIHSIAYGSDGIAFAGTNLGDVYRSTLAVTSITKDKDIIPHDFSLKQNYPNPFNPTTNIKFDLATEGFVSLRVYDILGREVATLVNKNLGAGSHNFSFDASELKSGVYFYRLSIGNYSAMKKMLLLK